MRDSVVFYRSFADAISDLDEEDQLAAFWNIINYALDGKEPEEAGPARAVFRMAKPQIDANERRYQNGVKGGRPKTKSKPNNNQSGTEVEANVNVNDNVNDNDNDREIYRESNPPPTIEEVRAYCKERGYSVDAETFVNFYQAKDWMIGQNRMTDWKAAVNRWEKSGKERSVVKPKSKTKEDFEQRRYDYASLDRQLFGSG